MPKRRANNQPITETSFRAILKQELKNFATKDDLRNSATKDDLRNFATKKDLSNFATKDDLTGTEQRLSKKFATKDDLAATEKRLGEKFATKKNLQDSIDELAQATKRGFDNTASKQELQEVIKLVKEEGKKTRRHFEVVAENIHRDVAGANQDEISSLKDADQKLDQRVRVVEKRLGIPAN